MKRSLGIITILLFFVWILPLGAFIKPSQEKKVCNGHRAICLCSHLLAKSQTQGEGVVLLKNAAGTAKETNGQGGASHDYVSVRNGSQNILRDIAFLEHTPFFYFSLFCKSIEHVPKV